jgi:hypothetical protein
MADSTSLCGSKTRTGRPCRQKVSEPGERCHLHSRSLDGKQILSLCFEVTDKVAALFTVYEVLERIHPLIMPLVKELGGLLMPEHFWDYGFAPKDQEQMRLQLLKAKEESQVVIEARYLGYLEKDKWRVEKAYRQILRRIELHE